jgi:hypothetical protein
MNRPSLKKKFTILSLALSVSAASAQSWTNLYSGSSTSNAVAYAIALSGNGNVYVTGTSSLTNGGTDFATVAYSSAGVPLWTNLYNATGSDKDGATVITADLAGNVYVSGTSSAFGGITLAYSTAGIPIWTNIYNGPGSLPVGIAADSNGNIYLLGGGGSNYVTRAYSSAGIPLWTNLYGVFYRQPRGIAVDNQGNVYVTGEASTMHSDGYINPDYGTVAYSSAGVPLWTNTYNGPGNSTDEAKSIAVSSNGNVYVTGYSVGTNSDTDFATIAYSSAGLPLWTNRYVGPGEESAAQCIATDKNGNVFVSGLSITLEGVYNYVTIGYSSAGTPLWTNVYAGNGSYNAVPYAISVDGGGNVYVTGYAITGNGNVADFATIAYSNAGQPLWTNLYNATGTGGDYAVGIVADANGNVYVTGNAPTSGGGNEYATIKYAAPVTTAPSFSNLSANLNGSISISILSMFPSTTRLWATTNSAPPFAWQPIYTNYTGGNWQYTDSNAMLYPSRYYRLSTP